MGFETQFKNLAGLPEYDTLILWHFLDYYNWPTFCIENFPVGINHVEQGSSYQNVSNWRFCQSCRLSFYNALQADCTLRVS
jgi:hypothetical protein